MQTPLANSRLSFGLYEVDLQTGEMWKAGYRIKLQSQPFKVLTVLLEQPGQIVSREELQLRLWGKDTVVDFDHSLGTAINKIREALGDSAENPHFIETLSRRGYRFLAPVTYLAKEPKAPIGASPKTTSNHAEMIDGFDPQTQGHEISAASKATVPPGGLATARSAAERGGRLVWILPAIAVCVALVAGYFAGLSRSPVTPAHIRQITSNGHLAPGADHMEDLAASATDGIHLFASTIESGKSGLVAVSLTGGAVVPISTPDELAAPALGDLSPDGSRLLLRNHLSPESEQPLWVVPTIGGSALRVGNILAHDAAWMPDGEGILYAAGNEIYLTRLTDNNPKVYASLPGRAFWLRWQSGGKLLRFTIIDPIAHTMSLWQISSDDRKPGPVLAGWTEPASECCGVWTADGRIFVFQSSHGGNTDLWKMAGNATSDPVRLTDGPLRFQAPVPSRSGDRIFFLGVDSRSEMKRFSPDTKELLPELGFLSSAVRVEYSRDGKWVAWTEENGLLWRARADGTEKLQLTPSSIDVFLSRWSPDGARLAFMGREPGKAWQIYLVPANGGEPERLLNENRNAGDPSWSPDGQSIVFGRINDIMGKEAAERTVQILNLGTHHVDTLPNSDGLFSPRWSPDGRYIAALSLDQRQVRLYSFGENTWSALPVDSGADPVWSSDSRFVYVHARLNPAQPIDRISIPEGRVEQVIRLADPGHDGAVDFVFGGLTPDNRPLIRERIFTGNFYSLDLNGR
jgi:Tol biopolymer transport system component/DNA-binding winged helix-turn-helix (wHTH) protein